MIWFGLVWCDGLLLWCLVCCVSNFWLLIFLIDGGGAEGLYTFSEEPWILL